MKKILYILTLCIISGTGVFAQNKIGNVNVLPITLREQGDSLLLEMDIVVDAQAMNKCQSWTILPELISSDSTEVMKLPHLLVNGKRKAQLYSRKMRFENTWLMSHLPSMKVDITKSSDTTLRYTFVTDYEMWMDDAVLNIHQILGSCANTDQWFSLFDIAQVELLPHIPYEVNALTNLVEPAQEIKQRMMQGEAFLEFEVGKYAILPNFRNNPAELTKITTSIAKVKDDENITITEISLKGYASPEGKYSTNERLSRNRSLALKDFIKSSFNLSEDILKTSSVAEDWDGLKRLVEESEMPQKYNVLGIIDSPADPDRKEYQLKALGSPYRYMLNEMFPKLRRVEYRIDYIIRAFSLEEAMEIVWSDPEHMSQQELYNVALNYPANSDEQDRIFEIIYRLYPEDAIANINAAARMLERGEDVTAKRYLERFGNHPAAYNNLGVYYLKAGQIDMAEELLEKAASNGIPEAEHNLTELRKKREDNIIMERYSKTQ